MKNKKKIIISNRLPIQIERKKDKLIIRPSAGGLATGLNSAFDSNEIRWVGWPGIVPKDEAEKHKIIALLEPLNLVPVFLSKEEIRNFYEGYSNEVLWPICHYQPSYIHFDREYWSTYVFVNKKFCEAALAIRAASDFIWVQDYQLMLLPQLLRQEDKDLNIGYFHHIPFPSEELFMNIPQRRELVEGLLGADLVGFHTFADSQNFLNACKKILNVPTGHNQLKYQDRHIFIESFPMGIDYDKFVAASVEPKVTAIAEQFRSHFPHQKIIISVDRLDYSKGILERLRAFLTFLEKYPEWHGKVVLYMLIVPSRDKVSQYKKLKDEINRKVSEINSIYGNLSWTPVLYFYKSLPFEELVGLYVASDVCMITSTRDGMNLVSKEYIACKTASEGVLILSEFAGASKELVDALIINPFNRAETADSIFHALRMSPEEIRERTEANLQIIRKFNIQHWVQLFTSRLAETKAIQRDEWARRISDKVFNSIADRYRKSHNRLFFLDYDGTLVKFQNHAQKASPTVVLYNLLDNIISDPLNTLVIISGRSQESLSSWFDGRSYYLVAEHGIWSNFPNFNWSYKKGLALHWMPEVKKLMEKLADQTPGAYIEAKPYSLAWHYRKVELGLGELKAAALKESLNPMLNDYGLQLLDGNAVIEVKNTEVNKGKAALEIAGHIKADFLLAIGDDVTDEDLFRYLPASTISIKVGSNKSAAKYYLDQQEDVIQFLNQLILK
ncbi:bifunctional alpha,alpha-trehalose-phosphate synthase (UDP-forming)/trehalose-phosphatase [Sphingobacterium sp. InxBP1]|uniref:bifunctional alpha,alpha-trehalose-phosphate synthase (UDP-forming)/trehalose-phosphatase n=1 Tax=Sphingobacterium sp. InxBP1 TaxID=2870328 RepID=UPI002244DEE7|nr:bifunctional alpha,alpha-trehalose-phosphate synthase (UDP-forming)/trehalose-phosphatase [Sphingobacterium sp. InxBP1]MCW8313259.1 bifunctional alpha,alpha-trehalose-phosphate synthase (UDP-forming)/trehalose-phosphatase [Sphingobacterium sp. InxBP1]